MALASRVRGRGGSGAPARARTRGTWKKNKAEWLLTAKPKVVPRSEVLSRRELEVMEMIAMGAKNSEIADRFVISQNTVKSHVSQILKKLSVGNRTEAAYRYQELYGHAPHGAVVGSTVSDAPAEIGAASVLPATVSKLVGSDRVLLELQDGRELEVPVLEPIRDTPRRRHCRDRLLRRARPRGRLVHARAGPRRGHAPLGAVAKYSDRPIPAAICADDE